VLYFGSSNFAGWHLAAARRRRGRRGTYGLVSEQSIYNLLTRPSSSRCCPQRALRLGVIPWSPLHGGLLGGVVRKEREGRAYVGRAKDALERTGRRSRPYEDFCASSARSRRTSGWPGCCTSRP
jgi:aryl-alcohol dehydrogenase-like predicted oxidoreductase